MHNGKKIGLKAMTPEQIIKYDLTKASRAKNQDKHKSENQIATAEIDPSKHTSKSDSKLTNEIQLCLLIKLIFLNWGEYYCVLCSCLQRRLVFI